MQKAIQQGTVAPGAHGQKQVSSAGDRCHTRINDNDFGAIVPRPPDVVRQNRETLAHVDASEDEAFRLRDVAPRHTAAVDAKRQTIGGAGRHHTQAAVIVDVPRLQRQTRKLAQ